MLQVLVGMAIWFAVNLLLGTMALYDYMRRRFRDDIVQGDVPSIWHIASVLLIVFGSMSTAKWATEAILNAAGLA